MNDKPKKRISLFTKIVAIVCSILILYFVSDDIYNWVFDKLDNEPLYEDTNIHIIKIQEPVLINDMEYTFNKLVIGDNYSTLLYGVKGISAPSPIGGAKLYQNSEILPYVSAGSSSEDGAAIAFECADGYENIELHIDIIEKVDKKQYTYPLEFNDNTAELDVNIDGCDGHITVYLEKGGYKIEYTGFDELMVKKEFGNRNPVIFNLLSENSSNKDFSLNNIPDNILITVKTSIYSGDTIVVPLS